MSLLVVDASVVLKWLLPDHEGENDVERAVALFDALRQGSVEVIQPPHWLAEVSAVLARLSPQTAADDTRDLIQMELEVELGAKAYVAAVELACSLPHHLFDTLYHAVALSRPDATLVTADERYYAKAHAHGRVVLLRDLVLA